MTLLERVLDSISLSPRLRTQIEQQARYEVPFILFGNADEVED